MGAGRGNLRGKDGRAARRRAGDGRSAMKRAFTIWEMLIVIMLLGAVGLMMPRIFTPTLRVVREAPAAGNAIITSHVMIEKLRRDVWGASDVRAAADGSSLIASTGGREIH